MSATKPAINWQDIDTVLLDIDGILLDLHYDNFVWDQVVPEAYAQLKQLPYAEAKSSYLHRSQVLGSIEFYSFDFWQQQTGLDHRPASATLAPHWLRADAEAFLDWLGASELRAIIATNADHNSLQIKESVMGLSNELTKSAPGL